MSDNRFGLDSDYFRIQLEAIARSAKNMTPDEMFRSMQRMMAVADRDSVMSDKWISVHDKHPERHQRIIAYMINENLEDLKVQIIRWWDYDYLEVSHWMPLPEPPKERG